MKKFFTFALLALVAQSMNASAADPFKWAPQSKHADAVWQHALDAPSRSKTPAKEPKTSADYTLPNAESFNYLDLPDGRTWFVTSELKKEVLSESEYYTEYNITGIKATIYNEQYQPVGYIEDDFELLEGTEKCSQIQFAATVTQNFFNYDENYEVMLMLSYKPTGAYGSVQNTRVYSLKGADTKADMVQTLPGYNTLAVNGATDSYSENFYMEFFTGQTETDTELLYTFDIYTGASWSTPGATSLKQFTVDMMYVMSDGENESMPVVINVKDRVLYVSVAKYEKTFFENPLDFNDDTLSADNHYIIELWSKGAFDSELTQLKTTSIACEQSTDEGMAMRSYALGMFSSQNDINFDFTDDALPVYIISVVDTGWQEDQSSCFFAVYDTDGNVLKTFGQDNLGFLQLSSIPGAPEQFCFLMNDSEGNASFSFMNFPSLENVTTIPATYTDDTNTLNLSTSLDRTASGAGYNYVIASSQGETDEEGNTLHPVAWFDNEGNLKRVDRINGGKNVNMINPYITGDVLNPWFFNSDVKQEYLYYVQRLDNEESAASHPELCIVNADGEVLLQYTFSSQDSGINSAIVNAGKNPAIWVAYNNFEDDLYHNEFISLPLNKLQGTGTEDDPYQIATIGDFERIKYNTSAHYILTSDLNYEGGALTPITEEFSGSLDGAGHTIKNFTLTDSPILNAIISNDPEKRCVIKDLTLSGVTIDGQAPAVLASYTTNAEISNVYIYNANIKSSSYSFGTLIDKAYTTTISGCAATKVTFTGGERTSDVGGIVSTLGDESSIAVSFFQGDITAASYVGGIAANTAGTESPISDCHVNANLTAQYGIGGIVASSARGPIERCVVEGELTATGYEEAYSEVAEAGYVNMVSVGGIAGQIMIPYPTWDENWNQVPGEWDTVIKGCVSALTAINIEAAADDPTLLNTAHRIAGRTCVNEDPEVIYDDNWNATLGDPYGPEPGLVDNYALDDLSHVSEDIADETTSTEGKSISYSELDRTMFESLGYTFFGYSAEEPWVTSDNGLIRLFFEANVGVSIAFNPSTISVVEGEKATVLLELENVEFDALTINSSDEEGCMPNPIAIDENGNVEVEIEVFKEGTYTITATNGTVTATLLVTGSSGVNRLTAPEAAAISYDGQVLRSADGSPISLYNAAGVLAKAPAAVVSVERLPTGVYIARSATSSLKIAVK